MLAAMDDCFTAWQEKTDGICLWLEETSGAGGPAATQKVEKLREQPTKINPGKAQQLFQLDMLWRPLQYHTGTFHLQPSETVLDANTQLLWQQSGSEYPLTWHQAHAYIHTLNQSQFSGQNNWRMPTVSELMSLITQPPHGGEYCADPMFDPALKRVWTCDRRSFIAAWYVNLEMGYVAWHDFDGYFFAKAVSSVH
jgi:serine/threonine-protein kinase